MAIILATQSPRRRQLMRMITENFNTNISEVDESTVSANSAKELAGKLALLKAKQVFAKNPNDVVIGCDTVVCFEEKVIGKPLDRAHAEKMLKTLSGKVHEVYTGVCIFAPGAETAHFVEETSVHFAHIPDASIAKYVKTDEPYDKAGGYGIQGWAARYVPRIEGCYYNVMGLPVAALAAALAKILPVGTLEE